MEYSFGPQIYQYVIVIIVNLSMIPTGLGIAWTSPVLVKLRSTTEPVLSGPLDEDVLAWITSIQSLTAVVANFSSSYLADKLGRKWAVVLGSIPRLTSVIMYIFATEVWMLMLGRCMGGVADAILMNMTPMYATEIASIEIRGSLGTIMQISSSLGIVLMLSIGPFISYFHLNLMFLSIVIACSIPQLFIPESPYFLYSKGQIDKCKHVLIKLRGSEILANEEIKEYSQIEIITVTKLQLLKNKLFLKTSAMVLFICAFVQLSGYNGTSFYLQTILESTNTASTMRPEVASVVCGIAQLCSCLCTILVIDRLKRKTILCTTLAGMSLGMIGIGTFFWIKSRDVEELSNAINYIPIVSLALVIFCYSAGLGSLHFLVLTELFDGQSRALGVTAAGFTTYLFVFLSVKYIIVVINAIGEAATFWWFSVNCAILLLFYAFWVPETKGKSFVDIQNEIRGKRCQIQKVMNAN